MRMSMPPLMTLSRKGENEARDLGNRIGRNPKTGEEVPILPRRVVAFRASHVLKERINRSLAPAGAHRAVTRPPA